MSNALTVFELSDLSSREELRSVVLTAIMFMSSQTMRRMDRQIPKALLIDEAWQMLRGGSMADFVETYSRTCRKYGASLITATQSLNDYYKSEGSLAALENSDWPVILLQKPDTIPDFQKHARFALAPYPESLPPSPNPNAAAHSAPPRPPGATAAASPIPTSCLRSIATLPSATGFPQYDRSPDHIHQTLW